MNKDFKEEYNNMLSNEVPDLWDRIEASLPDKQINVNKEVEKDKKKPSKHHKYTWMKICGGIAACLCVMVTGGVFLISQSGISSSTSMSMDAAMPECAYEEGAAADTTTATTTAGSVQETAKATSQEDIVQENQNSILNDQAAESAFQASDSQTADTADAGISKVQESQDTVSMEADAAEQGIEVSIEVIDCTIQEDEKIYQVRIKDVLASDFTVDSTVEFYIDKNSELTMEEGEQYTVTVRKNEEDHVEKYEILSIQQ